MLARLAEEKVLPSIIALRQVIWAEEARLGMKSKMDRKSLQRIMDDLVKEKAVKYIVMHIDPTATGALPTSTNGAGGDGKSSTNQSTKVKENSC